MAEFGKYKCPVCERPWTAMVENSGIIAEKKCRDCVMMPNWRNDFDSPPTFEQWSQFKDNGRKVRGNPPQSLG